MVSRQQAASSAGMSANQAKTAIRVANVPAKDFDKAVEGSGRPATVTKLAAMGTTPKPAVDLKGRNPVAFNRAMHFVGMLEDCAKEIAAAKLDDVLPGLIDSEREDVRRYIGDIDRGCDRIMARV